LVAMEVSVPADRGIRPFPWWVDHGGPGACPRLESTGSGESEHAPRGPPKVHLNLLKRLAYPSRFLPKQKKLDDKLRSGPSPVAAGRIRKPAARAGLHGAETPAVRAGPPACPTRSPPARPGFAYEAPLDRMWVSREKPGRAGLVAFPWGGLAMCAIPVVQEALPGDPYALLLRGLGVAPGEAGAPTCGWVPRSKSASAVLLLPAPTAPGPARL